MTARAAPPPSAPTDAELAVALRGGDRSALAAIYDRHAATLHDMCARTGARDEAADAVHDTFVTAMDSIDQLRDPERLRPWLFAIARNRVRRRGRRAEIPMPLIDDMGADDSSPEAGIVRDEQAAVLESALSGIEPGDREVLLLRDRYELDGSATAQVLGVDRATVDTRLHAARRRLRQSVVACQAGRHGAADCAELQRLRGVGPLTPTIRKRVARHVKSCETCAETVDRTAGPAALLGSLPLLLPPVALRDRVLSAGPAAAGAAVDPGSGRVPLVAGAVAATVAVAAVAWLTVGPGRPVPEETGIPAAVSTPVTTAAPAISVSTTVPSGAVPTPGPSSTGPPNGGSTEFCDVLAEAQGWYGANPGPASTGAADVRYYFTGSLERLQQLSAGAPEAVQEQLQEYTGAVSDLVDAMAPTWNLSTAAGGPDLSALRDLLEAELPEYC